MITKNDNIKTSLIVAIAQNRCIGKNNRMPWHISEDLKRFKSLTMGHPVIMGRKTLESILGYLKKPLPGRDSIIVTRNTQTLYPNTQIHQAGTIEQAIEIGQKIAIENGKDEVFIIGGAQIYTQSMTLAHRLYLTKVHRDIAGDSFFPVIDESDWEEIENIAHEEHNPPYSFITLERRQYLL
ncbi:MAG: dihydrofolate reductase [Alphaproteobacteria bacterium]|nr:dihydrofolate reductase [Alphaproteobacteria bacterium]